MEEQTRATPMTLISPVPRWWALWLRFIWALTSLFLRLRRPRLVYPFGRLVRLSFIHFAHWSLFDRMPPNGRHARRLPHPYLLFQTNFNLGWREYVEAFCLVLPTGIRANWRGAYGFPDPKPVGPFLDYVESRFTDASHFYCAYPDSSTRMVIGAIDARGRFEEFAGEASGPPARFRLRTSRSAGAAVLLGKRREPTDTISVLAPVLEGRETTLKEKLESLPKQDSSPLAKVVGTHLARWSVVEPLPYKKGKKKIDSVSYLLFVSWFDGQTSAYVRALRLALGKLADEIWGNCVGYPGAEDPGAFWAFMVEHSVKPRLQFAGYPERVIDVRASLELSERLSGPIVAASGMDAVELERTWLERRRKEAP